MWKCSHCDEDVDDTFDLCWNCGTSADGTEDPLFESADDSGPIADPVEDGEFAPMKELEDEFGEAWPDIVEVFVAESLVEARFVADQLRLIGIPAVSDRRNMNIEVLGGFRPNMWGSGPRVKVRPEDQVRAATWVEGFKKKLRDRAADDYR